MSDPCAHGHLLAVQPDGECETIPNTYEWIKHGLRQATLTFLPVSETAGLYADDEGMTNGAVLNVPASIFAGVALWGPVVLCHARPGPEGDTLEPELDDVALLLLLAGRWRDVIEYGDSVGQDLLNLHTADSGTIPPPVIYPWPDN